MKVFDYIKDKFGSGVGYVQENPGKSALIAGAGVIGIVALPFTAIGAAIAASAGVVGGVVAANSVAIGAGALGGVAGVVVAKKVVAKKDVK